MAKTVDETYYCTMQLNKLCNEKKGNLKKTEFYTSTNPTFFKNGRLHVCKTCMKEFCYVDGIFSVERLKRMLAIVDLPFLNKEFESSLADRGETLGVYIKNLYLNHKGKTSENSDLDIENDISIEGRVDDFIVTTDMIMKWGNLSKRDIEFLELNYTQWVTRHKCESRAEEILFEEIAHMQLDIKKTRESGGDSIKKVEALQKLFTSANIRPLDQSQINTNESAMMLGNMISTIEKQEPCEYFDSVRKKEFEDYMGYKKYFDDWVLRPLKNLATGSKDFDVAENFDEESEDGDFDAK